jgi:hypothetical protein
MRVGDDVYVFREGDVPSWFRWQGLPCTILSFENQGMQANCRMPDGNIVSFYKWELTSTWPPRSSGLSGSSTVSGPPYPTGAPRTIGSLEHPDKPLDRASEGLECRTCHRANEAHWFGLPPGHMHCRKCHATWSGLNATHCVMCHRTFTSPSALQRHKTAANRCKDPRTVTTKAGRHYFDEPVINEYRTEMWRQSGDGRPNFRSSE